MHASKKVGVLVGGFSSERDLSVRAGDVVAAALRENGHDAAPIFVDRDIDLALRQAHVDTVFLSLRGRYGADGCLQGLLELLGIPYTGSGVLASGLAMNRAKTKEVLRLANLPTAPAYVFRADASKDLLESHDSFGFPVMVRPVGAPSPMGCALARDEMELETAADDALRVDDEIMVERHIEGQTICVGILDGMALGAVEMPDPSKARLAMTPARSGEATARISTARYRSILRLATAAYEALGCEGAACVEMITSERHNEVIVGVDASPLLTPTSPLGRIAQGTGIKFGELVEEILKGARVRAHGHRTNRRNTQLTFDGHERRANLLSAAH